MSHVPHELSEAFPGECETVHALKADNPRFARLADEYHAVNRAIHRAETMIKPHSDFAVEDMRKTRLRLLDEIAALIRRAREGTASGA